MKKQRNGRVKLESKNVFGERLEPCCKFPMTGFARDGYCRLFKEDMGEHTVCVEMTDEFLAFSKEAGNDLSEPIEAYDFPGLIAGDRWCLCALRWVEAYNAGAAPKVVLSATDQSMLNYVPLQILQNFAVDETEDVI